ncbi:hypothetical protein ACFVS2_21900 [Brevibacillus sp. NPDC058079]|uniref:hypothetical protein n=1 Tax=Brevibacillus sp. NPDC058079 TaxID=3346330 RepID=UPI0036EF2765
MEMIINALCIVLFLASIIVFGIGFKKLGYMSSARYRQAAFNQIKLGTIGYSITSIILSIQVSFWFAVPLIVLILALLGYGSFEAWRERNE